MQHKRSTIIARKLRSDATDAETLLWRHLRGGRLLGAKFRRQMPIGPHIADFACEQARLVIELDGGQHADSTTDDARTRALEAAGYTVLRFWNHDVFENTDGVLEDIARMLHLASNS